MQGDWSQYTDEQRYQAILNKYENKAHLAGKTHDSIKFVRALRKNKKQSSPNYYHVILEGLSVLEAALRYQIELTNLFICPTDIYSSYARNTLEQAANKALNSFIVTKKVFQLISAKDNSNGLLAIAKIPKNQLTDILKNKPQIVVVLDGLETPGNIGSIIRTADAINAQAIIITNRKAKLYHPMMVRSSRGACFKYPIIDTTVEQASEFLLSHNYELVLADTDATEYHYEHQYSQRVALIMGSERFGIANDWYKPQHSKIAIPMYGDCDSLNVSVATSILLYEIRLKLNKLK
ncbi:RNA methyltransferase [Clostridium sp. 'deep sea']|uniref:TrmH family RNA methyltransferase n=1 Tax=Clostridium sp. 'deep sea' TaxID=2779445 RepID=UPI00189656F9|nr:RNA methyltransferase [Clostridium sp. 'deep sea']QOR33870.1 RNA methyltransferase [Clostridium sp. 'deep sea']